MRKVSKNYDQPPSILVSKARQNKIKTALATQSAQHFTNSDYSPREAKDALEALYNEKCSYCESTVKQVASLEVEHYRPKNGILEAPDHPGYYWLAVEWSNLVLGCPACNGQGAKGNKFPVAGIRVATQNPFDAEDKLNRAVLFPSIPPLSDEQPMLLNPEVDEPAGHLKYDGFGGIKGKTARGRKTIEICNLNRDPLYKERQTIINSFLRQCKIVFLAKLEYGLPNEAVDGLLIYQLQLLKEHWKDMARPYTAFVEYLLLNPTTCLYPNIEPAFKTDFKRAFAKFRKTELKSIS